MVTITRRSAHIVYGERSGSRCRLGSTPSMGHSQGLAQSGRVPALDAGCRRFESYGPDH